MKISKANKEVFKAMTILLFLVGLQYTFVLEQTTFLYPYFLCVASLILLFLGYWETAKYMVSYLCYQVLKENEKYKFVTRISREKWFFSIAGLILSIIGVKFLFNVSFATFESTHVYAMRNGLVFFIICGCIYINNKHIETFNIKKEKLALDNVKAIINIQTHNVEYIFKELNKTTLTSNIQTIKDLFTLNEISENDKIEWKDTVANLIRFVFVLFNINSKPNEDLNHDPIRLIITHYFMKNNEPIKLTSTGSEISNVKKEVDQSKELFIEYHDKLLFLINSNKITKI